MDDNPPLTDRSGGAAPASVNGRRKSLVFELIHRFGPPDDRKPDPAPSPEALPPLHRLVLIVLADFADISGAAWPSLPRLAMITGISVRWLRVILAELVAAGWLEEVAPGLVLGRDRVRVGSSGRDVKIYRVGTSGRPVHRLKEDRGSSLRANRIHDPVEEDPRSGLKRIHDPVQPDPGSGRSDQENRSGEPIRRTDQGAHLPGEGGFAPHGCPEPGAEGEGREETPSPSSSFPWDARDPAAAQKTARSDEGPSKPAKAPRSPTQNKPLPEGWEASEEGLAALEWALDHGLSREQALIELDKFGNHYRARGTKKRADYDRTWRNWIMGHPSYSRDPVPREPETEADAQGVPFPSPRGRVVMAYAQGQTQASGVQYPPEEQRRYELDALRKIIQHYTDKKKPIGERIEALATIAASYRKARPDHAERGWPPSQCFNWLMSGRAARNGASTPARTTSIQRGRGEFFDE